jgi:hypothetical protein
MSSRGPRGSNPRCVRRLQPSTSLSPVYHPRLRPTRAPSYYRRDTPYTHQCLNSRRTATRATRRARRPRRCARNAWARATSRTRARTRARTCRARRARSSSSGRPCSTSCARARARAWTCRRSSRRSAFAGATRARARALMRGACRAGTANRILEAKEKERAKETASDSEDDRPAKKKARRCAAARVDALSHPHSPLILQVLRVKQLLGLGLRVGLWIGLGQHVQFALALRGPSASAPYEPARSLSFRLARAERRAQPGAQQQPEALEGREDRHASVHRLWLRPHYVIRLPPSDVYILSADTTRERREASASAHRASLCHFRVHEQRDDQPVRGVSSKPGMRRRG